MRGDVKITVVDFNHDLCREILCNDAKGIVELKARELQKRAHSGLPYDDSYGYDFSGGVQLKWGNDRYVCEVGTTDYLSWNAERYHKSLTGAMSGRRR